MKKTYSKPMTTVVLMNYDTPLLAGSERSMEVGTGTKNATEALSRRGGHGFWDDEEE